MTRPTDTDGLLKMAELAQRAEVSPATVKHYLREGLLEAEPGEPAVVRTSRNMAYYPPSFVDRIRLVKRLQEERFMPLRAIRELLDEPGGLDRARTLVEREGAILDRLLTRPDARDHLATVGREELIARTEVPPPLLDKFAEIGVLGDGSEGYDPDEVLIVEAIMRFRRTGFGEEIGFTAYDVLRYLDGLAPLVREETQTFLHRMAEQELDADRAVDLMLGGVAPLRDLVGAIHGRLMRHELARVRRPA
ncbi:MerR family transcriptional regulator [Patulibacter defluvii]|uniref:MerR family transcriptional regulator n=1 Tax=Patulibacter defluvii TaxID=3095358 RepID=UPI002A75EA6A|nr:MerR family transcriptional regulator [Patulibacter sp. DM4]